MDWTDEKLAALSPRERANLYANARAASSEAGRNLVARIEACGLPFSESACINLDDPLYRVIHEIIFSPEGKSLAIEAAERGLPALAGVDPLLNERLTVDYGPHNMTTNTAGAIMAELMRSLGYVAKGSRPMPPGCVAKSAVFWDKK